MHVIFCTKLCHIQKSLKVTYDYYLYLIKYIIHTHTHTLHVYDGLVVISVLMFVSHMRFQTSYRFAKKFEDSACKILDEMDDMSDQAFTFSLNTLR